VRLIDENDEQVGVIDLADAKQRAKDAGLDLVEVSPQSSPPVCKIMDYGKWKYAQRKKEQKARSHTKQSELKGMRLRPKIDSHDLEIKLNKARQFLEEGHKVQFTMLFRGREMAHRDLGLAAMRRIADGLSDISKVEQPAKLQFRRALMVLAPDRKTRPPEGKDKDTEGKGKDKAQGGDRSGSAARAPRDAEQPEPAGSAGSK